MAITGAIVGVASIGASVFGGQKAKQQQRRAVRRQESAQKQAEARAISEQRRAEQEQRRLNRKAPDVGSLLGREQGAAAGGTAGTLLTGAGGVGKNKLQLGGGGSTLLGGV